MLFSYCDEGNARLLLDYGFATPLEQYRPALLEKKGGGGGGGGEGGGSRPISSAAEPLHLPWPPPGPKSFLKAPLRGAS